MDYIGEGTAGLTILCQNRLSKSAIIEYSQERINVMYCITTIFTEHYLIDITSTGNPRMHADVNVLLIQYFKANRFPRIFCK